MAGRPSVGQEDRVSTTIALAIPNTPWVPERAASMGRLREDLGIIQHGDMGEDGCSGITPLEDGWCARAEASSAGLDHYREFTDKAPNWVWSVDLWKWLISTGAGWGLQLQDDTMTAPCFWPAIRAMLSSLPTEAEIVGLSSVHPMAMEMARRGHRWYRTTHLVVGWAYAVRIPTLAEFLTRRDALIEKHGKGCEDVLLGQFAAESEKNVWHPCPTIVDHDTSIPSSYQNDHHSTRRPQVTWRDYGEGSMTDTSWWKPSGLPQILPMPPQRVCWFCLERGIKAESRTGAGICGVCLGACIGSFLQGGTP